MQRQRIRPSLAELNAEFDQSDHSESDDGVPEYAPAATPFRGPPPIIASGSSIPRTIDTNKAAPLNQLSTSKIPLSADAGIAGPLQPRKAVRIAPSSTTQVHEIESIPRRRPASQLAKSRQIESTLQEVQGPESFRFNLHEDEVGEDEEDESEEDADRQAPLIGTIQERAGIDERPKAKQPDRKGQSRFALSRKEARQSEGVSNLAASETPRLSAEDEEWLDEDGQPMSAFRADRLRKQGKRPPSIRRKESTKMNQAVSQVAAKTEESLSSMKLSISRENDASISAMSAEEVEQALNELRELHGASLLEKFKNLKETKCADRADLKPTATLEQVQTGTIKQPQSNNDEQTSEYIRSKYFPNEPEKLPLSLQWTRSLDIDDEQKGEKRSYRFDFFGLLIKDGALSEQDTHLTGLHHHGEEQNRAGYSFDELLHLARSTLPSQRILALQTLERILSHYPEGHSVKDGQAASDEELISKQIDDEDIRGKAGVIASWYIEDRQVSLRSTALRCLRSCFFTTMAGPCPVAGVVVEVANSASKDKIGGQAAKETASYNITSQQFYLALLPSLCNVLCERSVTSNDVETCLEVLNFICSRSPDTCTTLMQRRNCVESILEACIVKKSWPVTNEEDRPIALSLRLLLIVISSHRVNATSLIERGCIDPLLRFLAMPPWLTKEDARFDVWIYFDLTLQIYAALATYGMYSDVLQRGFSVLAPIEEWIRSFDVQAEPFLHSRLLALHSCLHCFNMWTVCAIDPHQTRGHHDIGWSHVAEWWEYAVECGQRLATLPLSSPLSITLLTISAAAEAVSLLDNWLECASRNKHVDEETDRKERVKEEIVKLKEPLMKLVDQIDISLLQSSDKLSESTAISTDRPFWMTGLAQLNNTADLCRAATKVIHFVFGRPEMDSVQPYVKQNFLKASRLLLQQPFWRLLDRDDVRQTGAQSLRRIIIDFCSRSIDLASGEEDVEAVSHILQLLPILKEGDEWIAQHVIITSLSEATKSIASSDLFILTPFLNEMLRSTSDLHSAPLLTTSSSLSTTQSLFIGVPSAKEDDEDVDPISGAELWKCAASGLPLRADWPLTALDDLLHSGNCASLNRKDALSTDWDANERQIVISSLRVALQVCRLAMQNTRTRSTMLLPSSAEIHLAIFKVFMLEEEQSQDPKATGLITGRDLFRDVEVCGMLEELFALAKELELREDDHNDDLEKAATRQYGTSLPFYQLYTSFIGLYDSMSFGMELFGRTLMLPQTKDYACDFKRLLWIDYAFSLSTLTTRCSQLPYHSLNRFLTEEDEDEGVVQAMVDALLRGLITKSRNELVYHIAVQQIGHIIWKSSMSKERGAVLAKAFFSPIASRSDPSLLIDIQDYGLEGLPDVEEERDRRETWLRLVATKDIRELSGYNTVL